MAPLTVIFLSFEAAYHMKYCLTFIEVRSDNPQKVKNVFWTLLWTVFASPNILANHFFYLYIFFIWWKPVLINSGFSRLFFSPTLKTSSTRENIWSVSFFSAWCPWFNVTYVSTVLNSAPTTIYNQIPNTVLAAQRRHNTFKSNKQFIKMNFGRNGKMANSN